MFRTVRCGCFFFLLSIFLFCISSQAIQAPSSKRIAVLDFVPSGNGSDPGAGKLAADVLEQRLVQDGRYSMIERNGIDRVLAEQNFGASGRVDAATAARIGKILGVDAVIFGSISQCNVQTETVPTYTGNKPAAKGVCSVSAKVVDSTTAEILADVSGNGETPRKVYYDKPDNTAILRAAMNEAADGLCLQLDKAPKMSRLRAEPQALTGVVADVSGETLIVSMDSTAGISVGSKLDITRPGRQITDPRTNQVVKTIVEKLGEATVTEVDDKTVTATFSGKGEPKRGDSAKAQP